MSFSCKSLRVDSSCCKGSLVVSVIMPCSRALIILFIDLFIRNNSFSSVLTGLSPNSFALCCLYISYQDRLLLNKARRTKNKPFWTFSISFEEAKQYRRKYLNVLTRESQWEEIIVDVYL